jgi:hypothetical protein
MCDDGLTPEDFIICETQEELFCARHALSALVQNREVFDDIYLTTLGEQLATEELLIHEAESLVDDFYFIRTTGYYHIQVIQRALQETYDIELIQLNKIDDELDSLRDLIKSHIIDIQALFIHQDDHYFCVRRFDTNADYFFIIDSLRPVNHKTIKRHQIYDYVDSLHQCDCSIYVPVARNIAHMEPIGSNLLFS